MEAGGLSLEFLSSLKKGPVPGPLRSLQLVLVTATDR